MKISSTNPHCSLAFLGLLSLAAITVAPSQGQTIIDFNGGTSATWTSQFQQNNSGQSFTWNATGGVLDQAGPSAGGALSTNSNPSIVYTTSTFAGTNTSFTISASIRGGWQETEIGNGSGSFILGFGTDVGTAFAGGTTPGTSFAIRLQTTTVDGTIAWRTRLNTANGTISGASNMTGLSGDNWYNLSATFTKGVNPGDWTYTATLFDLGTAGTGLGTPVTNGTVSGSFTQLDSWNATSLYAAVNFRAVSGAPVYNTTQLDNFTVAAIPEPSTALLMGAGLASLCLRRGRRERR